MEPYYALKLHDIRSNIERRILYQTSEASKVKLRLQNDCSGENFEIQNIIPESLHYIRYEMKKSYKIENIIEQEIKNICSKCESLQCRRLCSQRNRRSPRLQMLCRGSSHGRKKCKRLNFLRYLQNEEIMIQ